jgi:hypothetical protein
VAAVCRSYASHGEALKAVMAALDAGVDAESVLVLTGEPTRDTRDAPVGGFAGTEEPDAPVGSFAGAPHRHDEPMGAFAGSGAERGGSFADTDREVVTTYPGGVERMHAVGHRRVLRLLLDAGLDRATAKRDLDALHGGRVLVLVDLAEGDAERIVAVLGGDG